MRFSVYRYGTKSYDYYDGPGPNGTHATAPPAPLARGTIGAVAESATWRLPMGARKVGSGPLPKGRVASSGGAALGDIAGVPTVAIVIGVGLLAWRFLR